MPRPPAPQARRGTAFHRWLEERFSQQRLIDPDDLLGAVDDPAAGDPADGDANDLAALRELFESGEWGNRWPVEVEVPFETLIAGRPVRGRIDAVFGDAPAGGFDVVDWKTGHPPRSRGRASGRRGPARRLPAGLGPAGRGTRGPGPGGVLLRTARSHAAAGRPAGRGGTGRADRADPGWGPAELPGRPAHRPSRRVSRSGRSSRMPAGLASGGFSSGDDARLSPPWRSARRSRRGGCRP